MLQHISGLRCSNRQGVPVLPPSTYQGFICILRSYLYNPCQVVQVATWISDNWSKVTHNALKLFQKTELNHLGQPQDEFALGPTNK